MYVHVCNLFSAIRTGHLCGGVVEVTAGWCSKEVISPTTGWHPWGETVTLGWEESRKGVRTDNIK